MRTSSVGQSRIAVVIDATFGDDETGLAVTHQTLPDADRVRP